MDRDSGLSGLRALLRLRVELAPLLSIQIVAFTLSGVIHNRAILEQALREGAELVGGLDPVGIDEDVEGQLDIIFGIAERHGCRSTSICMTRANSAPGSFAVSPRAAVTAG